MSVATGSELRCPPACVHEPPGRAGSYGEDVAEIAERLGRPLVPEQVAALDVLMAHDRRGRFLSIEAGVEGPRQTVGKSGAIMLPIALWTALTDPDEITWTAHLAETSLKQFADVAGADPEDESSLIAQHSWLRRRVRRVSWENGSEAVHFVNGATLSFRVRSPGRGRGMSGNTIIDDEFLYMTAEQIGAQAPVLATRSLHGNARAYRASSAALARSEMLRKLRARAAAGDPSLTYVGWWAPGGWESPGCTSSTCGHEPGTPGCRLDDEDLWLTCNPLVGRLVSIGFLRSMRAGMTPREFGREFLGWQEAGDEAAETISLEDWAGRVDAESRVRDGARPSFAVDVRPDQRAAAIAVGGESAAGGGHVGLIRHRAGTEWVVDEMVELKRKHRPRLIVVDGASPAAGLIPALKAAKLDVKVTSSKDMTAACSGLRRAVLERTVTHRGDPLVAAALEGARRRDLGDGGWGWARKRSDVDISPLVAVTLAHWALAQAPKVYDIRKSFG